MEQILSLFEQYGVTAMFFVIFLEYACFPISSEIVLPFTGALAGKNNIPFLLVLPLSVLAGILGTGFCYLVGRIGGERLIDCIIRRFPKSKKGIEDAKKRFEAYGKYAVCVGRIIPLCRTYIAFIAGASGQSPSVYFPFSFLGITIWNSALLSLGFFLGDNWSAVSDYYDRYKHILLPIVLTGIFFFFVKFLLQKRTSRKGN